MGKAGILLRMLFEDVTVADIVPHEKPKDQKKISSMVKALKAGEHLPPILISHSKYQHRVQGPGGMEDAGYGFGILDGHHRLEAYRRAFGKDYVFKPGQLEMTRS